MQYRSSKRPDITPPGRPTPADFPGVGLTLRTYKHDPFRELKTAPGPMRVPRPSVWQLIRRSFSLKRTVIVLLIVVVFITGWLGWKFAYNLHSLFGGNPFSIFTSTKLKGEDSGRVNILLAGYSADDPGHGGADLTDSIMLLSIDTKNHDAFMLSIPRDLYVNIPGDGYGKINAVYENGGSFRQSGYPSGGMGLLEKIVSRNFGVDINYYALINYAALKEAVDAVGGIDINVHSSDPRGIYDPDIDWSTHKPLVKLSNGWHHLNGEQALDLARARGHAYGSYGIYSDFDRTGYQRQMLAALKEKTTSAGVVTNPIRLSQLFDAVGRNIQTDLTLSDVHRLYDVTKDIGGNNIKSLSLDDANGNNLLSSYNSYASGDALIPAAGLDDYSDIRAFLRQATSDNPVVRENADVVLLNAAGSSGLAAQQRKVAEAHYLNITDIGTALASQSATTIIDSSGGHKPATKHLLEQLYGGHVTTTNPYSGQYHADFIVVLGADQVTGE
jgi:LCP family protein required for cell wall assembly